MQEYYNVDCLEGMKQFPDKYFELAIVDPPYFSGPEKRKYYGNQISSTGVPRVTYEKGEQWTVPNDSYFEELKRVSKNQIIWGINYYDIKNLGSGRIVWDKVNGTTSFSDCEIAYCSLHDSVRIFSYMWNGMMQGKSITDGRHQRGNKKTNEQRIHPTQKPIDLYIWILQTYAKKGDLILDTHVGSASSLIACYKLNFEYVGFEIDKAYYDLSQKRLNSFKQQLSIFDY